MAAFPIMNNSKIDHMTFNQHTKEQRKFWKMSAYQISQFYIIDVCISVEVTSNSKYQIFLTFLLFLLSDCCFLNKQATHKTFRFRTKYHSLVKYWPSWRHTKLAVTTFYLILAGKQSIGQYQMSNFLKTSFCTHPIPTIKMKNQYVALSITSFLRSNVEITQYAFVFLLSNVFFTKMIFWG